MAAQELGRIRDRWLHHAGASGGAPDMHGGSLPNTDPVGGGGSECGLAAHGG